MMTVIETAMISRQLTSLLLVRGRARGRPEDTRDTTETPSFAIHLACSHSPCLHPDGTLSHERARDALMPSGLHARTQTAASPHQRPGPRQGCGRPFALLLPQHPRHAPSTSLELVASLFLTHSQHRLLTHTRSTHVQDVCAPVAVLSCQQR